MPDWFDLGYEESYSVNDPEVGYGRSRSEREIYIEKMRRRTKAAAIAIINYIENCKPSTSLRVISNQIIKSATSTAANYRAACLARSGREFFAKMSIVVEEADETVFWLEILYESKVTVDKEGIIPLGKEWREISKIMNAARKNAKGKK
ncbi:four helix bundle protein [Lewinella sp. IMCC34191]|uniref:four helix bundle protein n=1 Tax=Lewinella sp. IMCC34191 TaxID=2259172 RepID=UPI0018E4E0A6|nr:four helix bundle protein [Lewinella sp. IMCC34191]